MRGRFAILDQSHDAGEFRIEGNVLRLADIAADDGLKQAVLVAVPVSLADQFLCALSIATLIEVGGVMQDREDIVVDLKPEGGGGLSTIRLSCGFCDLYRIGHFGLDYDSAFQFRQCGPDGLDMLIDAAADCGDWLALDDQLADVTEFGFQFVAFSRRNIDADRAFKIFKQLEIGLLHIRFGKICLPLLIFGFCLSQDSFNSFHKALIIGPFLGPDRKGHGPCNK